MDIHNYNYTKLDARINGYALLRLDESRLKRFGVTYRFRCTLINIIENLVCVFMCDELSIINACNIVLYWTDNVWQQIF